MNQVNKKTFTPEHSTVRPQGAKDKEKILKPEGKARLPTKE